MCTLTKPIGTVLVLLAVSLFGQPAQAKYSGGTGEPNDPYQIATAEDLMLLGESPEDYDKHFILTADIDLDPNLPGRKVFDKAVIAPGTQIPDPPYYQETPFTGVFDGNGHTILHLRIVGGGYVGLFGQLGSGFLSTAEVKDLGVVDVNIAGSGNYIGGLVGHNYGSVTHCYSAGTVSGDIFVGGLGGYNHYGNMTQCYSTGAVNGKDGVGGLAGDNYMGSIATSYSTGEVSGKGGVGGLVGDNWVGHIADCYSTGAVSGGGLTGGLVGRNLVGHVTRCYSTGVVMGSFHAGGLVADDFNGTVTASFWDTRTSGLTMSAGGTGKTTAEMQTAKTFLDAGWDFAGEAANGADDVWRIDEGKDYPRLQWESPRVKYGGGSGTPDDPYQIWTAEQMNAIGANTGDWSKQFKLMADIDLSRFDGKDGRPTFNLIGPDTNLTTWYYDGIPFIGTFDGNGHTISHLTLAGQSYLGLFCYLDSGAEVRDLGVVDVNIIGVDSYVGGLAGYNLASLVTQCCSTGVVSAGQVHVGGLIGYNRGRLTHSYSTATVVGDWLVGGLTGDNWGTVTGCYSAGVVTAMSSWPSQQAGGLIPGNWGTVSGSFWDTQTSGQVTSYGGTSKTTAEMQTARTFLEAGWDFVGETANGTEDIWWILEGKDYPRLWWENAPQ